jgi:hypothetical protein
MDNLTTTDKLIELARKAKVTLKINGSIRLSMSGNLRLFGDGNYKLIHANGDYIEFDENAVCNASLETKTIYAIF